MVSSAFVSGKICSAYIQALESGKRRRVEAIDAVTIGVITPKYNDLKCNSQFRYYDYDNRPERLNRSQHGRRIKHVPKLQTDHGCQPHRQRYYSDYSHSSVSERTPCAFSEDIALAWYQNFRYVQLQRQATNCPG